MNKSYVEVVLNIPPENDTREFISFQLHEFGFNGFLEDENGLHCYIPKPLWTDSLQTKFRKFLDEANSNKIKISSIIEIQDQNWNRQWEESIQPVDVSEKIVITPSWHTLPNDGKKIILVIDPKMSFGTGYHESTRLMLRMMERYVTPNSLALDVGTGTGILAIAAVKLGSRYAIGIDVDEWSYTNAQENVSRNGCEQLVNIRPGSLEVVKESNFDVILANIIRATITELLPVMTERLAENGTLLLSGLLTDDREAIEHSLKQNKFELLSTIAENEWIGIAARKM